MEGGPAGRLAALLFNESTHNTRRELLNYQSFFFQIPRTPCILHAPKLPLQVIHPPLPIGYSFFSSKTRRFGTALMHLPCDGTCEICETECAIRPSAVTKKMGAAEAAAAAGMIPRAIAQVFAEADRLGPLGGTFVLDATPVGASRTP